MRTRSFWSVTCLLTLVCTVTAPGGAANAGPKTVPPNIYGLNFAQFCPVIGKAPTLPLLARAIIISYGVPLDFVDWNDTGETGYEDLRNAVTVDLCSIAKTPAQKNKCFPEKPTPVNRTNNALKQGRAVQELELTLGLSVKKNDPDFDLVLKKGVLHFSRVRQATKLDVHQSLIPLNIYGQPSLAWQALARNSEFFKITCQSETAGGSKSGHATSSSKGNGVASSGDKNSEPALTPEQKEAQQEFMMHFRLRGDAADLPISQDNDAFKGASSASLSATADNVNHKSTLIGKFALGFAFNPIRMRDWVINPIPYVKFERNSTSGTGASNSGKDVDNIGFGLLASATVPALFPADSYADVALQSDYTAGLRNKVEIGKLQFSYAPRPFMRFIGFPADLGFLGLRAYLYTIGLINVGQVFKSGDDTMLHDSETFTQGGVRFSAAIYGTEGSPFDKFSVPVTYTNLYGFAGPYRSLQNFSVGIKYDITKNFSIGVSHLSGRNLDTFEKVHSYEFKLGLKY